MDNRCKIQEMIRKYDMKPHEENGRYAECSYPFPKESRAASGSCYFYSGPGEKTLFHRIDCDEYWCYNAGSPLTVWIISDNGELTIKKLGIEPDAEPMLYFPKGVIFGSRNMDPYGEGTFFTCITVPRFSYHGFRIIEQEEVLRHCPKAAAFWD